MSVELRQYGASERYEESSATLDRQSEVGAGAERTRGVESSHKHGRACTVLAAEKKALRAKVHSGRGGTLSGKRMVE